MATLTDPDRESFKLSMLLYDTRYRSMTIQVIAMIGFVSIVFWLMLQVLFSSFIDAIPLRRP